MPQRLRNGMDDVAVVPLTVLQKLVEGSLLVSRREYATGVVDISLEDTQHRYDLTYIRAGERVTLYRVSTTPGRAAPR
jgi:hypothetical protein